MITIQKSPTADTRTCDVTKVTRETLVDSSRKHIQDVQFGLAYFRQKLAEAGAAHDFTKLEHMDQFYSDFKTKFEKHEWWDAHQKIERHHLATPVGVREDVDLIDVLEFITDCVMAGMARAGSVYELKLPPEVFEKAFQNTVAKLKAEVVVAEGNKDGK